MDQKKRNPQNTQPSNFEDAVFQAEMARLDAQHEQDMERKHDKKTFSCHAEEED